MTDYNRGGYLPSGSTMVRVSPDRQPADGGDPLTIYADECMISRDQVCIRTDAAHAAARPRLGDWWVCPLHDRGPDA